MIKVLTGRDAILRGPELAEMFRQRDRVFRQELGWNVTSENGQERDAYDAMNPVYLLAYDEDRLVGSTRLLPTTSSYMLADVFPQLLDGRRPPRSARVWEGTRLAVEPAARGAAGLRGLRRYAAEIFCGVVECCLAYGIEEFVTVYDDRVAELYRHFGCEPRWSGEWQNVGGTQARASLFTISDEVLERIRRRGGVAGPVIAEAPWLNDARLAA
ncbi:MAG TPA: acyl-homoserine-lactone synthase [Alphaproteobacteria bacterium]|nr:acyl-homoserine-lactone synthase [Alphaproteobacteria bacterium]